ncbi:hypothetical protein EVAR_72865_1 [Eumeta japonica]|uniref:Uncharacterized protein n=1 Tax=Eumeta variegata TaxID=151549 RepID=A0A4C1SUL6_EUMVA|nr:hypothetical protein EVAR_72865_1 [Eumeta japonica]
MGNPKISGPISPSLCNARLRHGVSVARPAAVAGRRRPIACAYADAIMAPLHTSILRSFARRFMSIVIYRSASLSTPSPFSFSLPVLVLDSAQGRTEICVGTSFGKDDRPAPAPATGAVALAGRERGRKGWSEGLLERFWNFPRQWKPPPAVSRAGYLEFRKPTC